MRNSKTIIIAAVLFLLLSAAFAMSGDGGQQPVKQEKGNEAVQIQSEQAQQAEISTQQENKLLTKNSSNGTYIDKYGYDTGMTEEEFEKFKEDYRVRFNRFRDHDFYLKIDFSKKEVWKELGASKESENYKEYKLRALQSSIIIIGKVTSSKVVNNDSFYVFEIEEILKGEEIIIRELGEIPESILYPTLWGSSDSGFRPIMDRKGVYFFGFSSEGTIWRRYGYWMTNDSQSTVLKLDGGGAITREGYNNRLKAQRMREEQEKKMNEPPPKQPTREELIAGAKSSIANYERQIAEGRTLSRGREHAYKAIKADLERLESGGEVWTYPERILLSPEDFKKIEMDGTLEESFDEVIANIKKTIEINDHLNFYKKDFRQRGDHE
jgi:hypothetical protein